MTHAATQVTRNDRILALVEEDKTNREVAAELGIKPSVVSGVVHRNHGRLSQKAKLQRKSRHKGPEKPKQEEPSTDAQ